VGKSETSVQNQTRRYDTRSVTSACAPVARGGGGGDFSAGATHRLTAKNVCLLQVVKAGKHLIRQSHQFVAAKVEGPVGRRETNVQNQTRRHPLSHERRGCRRSYRRETNAFAGTVVAQTHSPWGT
jgi:hypothetical protein